MIDRKACFDEVRKTLFGGQLNSGQVRGMDIIFDEADRRNLDLRWTAYILATAFHETNQFMLPVIETRQASESTNPSVDTAIRRLETAWANGNMSWVKNPYWRKDQNGLSWLGRGLPQLTHKENYEKMAKITGVDLVNHPDMALELEVAVEIMFEGMIRGSFTGKKLADYFDKDKMDFFNARRIINATQKAGEIEQVARKFWDALKKSVKNAEIVDNVIIPPPPPPPLVIPAAPPPEPRFWDKFKALFSPKGKK